MAEASMHLGVVLERRQGVTAWADEIWQPVAVLPGVPELPAGSALGGGRFYAGAFEMEWHRADTPTYRDNLATLAPRIWVVLRPRGEGVPGGTPGGMPEGMPDVVRVTADPAEGEAFTEAGSDLVETVPMPAEIAAALAEFIAAHHVERAFVKRKRRNWAADEPDDFA
jgi:hypothetical protein